jgi:hypothetical protein
MQVDAQRGPDAGSETMVERDGPPRMRRSVSSELIIDTAMSIDRLDLDPS